MGWITAKYSKKAVRRAGETLVSNSSTEQERSDSMDILSNWRSAHAYPMHAVLIFLRTKSAKIDSNSIVVQRLKRTPSILAKLVRYSGMKLDRMQDISGCRSVVSNVSKTRELRNSIVNSRTRHILHREDDYITNPKPSGYRSIHLVYKYNGEKNAYQNYFVEIQLRSKIQHAWATAVEVVDHFTKQALKASQGKKDWLDFFKFVSPEFAKLERCPPGEQFEGIDTLSEVLRLEKKLNAIARLNAFTVSTHYIAKKTDRKSDYFLLELQENAQHITVTQFAPDQLSLATAEYLDCEKQAKQKSDYDVVLVSASSMHGLRAAYPNYFADSKEFIRLMHRVIRSKG